MGNSYLIGIDRGTSGIRAAMFDIKGTFIGGAVEEIETHREVPGRSVNYADETYAALFSVLRKTMEETKVDPKDVVGISMDCAGGPFTGFTADGDWPFGSVNVDDARHYMNDLAAQLLGENGISQNEAMDITGSTVQTRSPNILKVLYDEDPERFAQVVGWAHSQQPGLFKVLGADGVYESRGWATNCGNYDVLNHVFSEKLTKAYGFNDNSWCPLKYAGECVGSVSKAAAEKTGLAQGTPLYMGNNDSSPQIIGCGAIEEGDLVASYGTFGISLMRVKNTSNINLDPKTAPMYMRIGSGGFRDDYSVCAIVFGCGASYAWLKDNVCFGYKAAAAAEDLGIYDYMNKQAELSSIGANGLYYYPEIINKSAAFLGISTATVTADMVRAVMEGMAYSMLKTIRAVETTSGIKVKRLFASGHITKTDVFRHILADMYDMDIVISKVRPELINCLGSAMTAGIGAGCYDSVEDACAKVGNPIETVIKPNPDNVAKYQAYIDIWEKNYTLLSSK